LLKRVFSLILVALLLWQQPLHAEGSDNLTVAVDQATEAYNAFHLSAAESILKKTIADAKAQGKNPSADRAYVPVYKMLGVVYHAEGKDKQALTAFENVARLAPETVLSEHDYPPSVRNLYSQARQTVFERGEAVPPTFQASQTNFEKNQPAAPSDAQGSSHHKSFWKKPVVWIVGGLLLAGAGAGMAVALGGGSSDGGAPKTNVSINSPAPGLGGR
jgi:hypothetical protein